MSVDGLLWLLAGAAISMGAATAAVRASDALERRRQARALAVGGAVPHPLPENTPSPRHFVPSVWLADQRPEPNLRSDGPLGEGPIPERVRWVLSEVAQVLPAHTFTLRTSGEVRGALVEECAFAPALAALVLHAAQVGRSHTVEVRTSAPDPAGADPAAVAVWVEIATPPERRACSQYLGGCVLALSGRLGGGGSLEHPALGLVWPVHLPDAPVRSSDASAG